MPDQFKSAYSQVSTDTFAMTLDNPNAAGSTMVLFVVNNAVATISAINSLESAFTILDNSAGLGLAVKTNTAGGTSSFQVVLSTASSSTLLIIHEVPSVSTVRSYGLGGDTGTGADSVTQALSPISAGDYLVGFVCDYPPGNNGGQFSQGTGFTLREQNLASGYYASETKTASGSESAITFADTQGFISAVGGVALYQASTSTFKHFGEMFRPADTRKTKVVIY